jgi:hypothetical protein
MCSSLGPNADTGSAYQIFDVSIFTQRCSFSRSEYVSHMNSKSPDTLEADQQEITISSCLGYDSGDRSMVHTKYEWNRDGWIFIRSRIEPYPDRIKAIRYLNGTVAICCR